MAVTLQDIARQTRTSVSTVSRVLAGGSGAQRISDATRKRVMEVARQIGYRPNLIARSLRTRKSNTIALLVSDIANPWFAQLASLIEQTLHRQRYTMMVCNSGEQIELEREYLRLLPQKGIDGLIVVPVADSAQALHEFLPEGLPLVILDRPVAGAGPSICSDEEKSAGLLCDTLARAGVRKIVLVSGPQSIISHRQRAQIVAERFEILLRHQGPAMPDTGRQAWIASLDLHPDAFVCTNNALGQGILDCIGQIEPPPIIGCFDEIPMMHLLPLPIAACVQDIPALAEGCVQLLMPQLQGRQLIRHDLRLPTRAVVNAAFEQLHRSR